MTEILASGLAQQWRENHGHWFSGALPPLIEAVRFCGMKRSRVLLARPGRRTVNMLQATLPMYLPRLAAYLENSCNNYRTGKEDSSRTK
jgi:hypothetical protein